MYTPVRRDDALSVLDDAEEGEKKKKRKAKQAVLLHASSMFDANECALDWFPGIMKMCVSTSIC